MLKAIKSNLCPIVRVVRWGAPLPSAGTQAAFCTRAERRTRRPRVARWAAAAAARLLTATHLSSWNGPSSAANYVDDGLRHVVTIRYAPPTLEVYLDYELVMHTEVWLRPQSEAGGEDGPLSLPVVPAGGDAASARANVTAPALRILDEQGLAQLGFAAGRSEVGLEQYEIHEWWFKRNVDGFHGEERLSRRDEKVV